MWIALNQRRTFRQKDGINGRRNERIDSSFVIQRVQNAAARILLGCTKFCHSFAPVLYELHWLPVSFRIKFKILLITFKILHDQCPTYLRDHITLCNNGRYSRRYSLRSSERTLLKQTQFKTLKTLGDRSFSAAAPRLWNELPFVMRIWTILFANLHNISAYNNNNDNNSVCVFLI